MNERNVREGYDAYETHGTAEYRVHGTTGTPGHDTPGENPRGNRKRKRDFPAWTGSLRRTPVSSAPL